MILVLLILLLVVSDTHADVIIYNRIPKTGSTSITEYLKQASKTNGFVLVNVGVESGLWISDETMQKPPHYDSDFRAMVERIKNEHEKVLIVGHFYYVDVDDVKYINVMRNPVDRVVSQYRYSRSNIRGELGENYRERHGALSINECVTTYKCKQELELFGQIQSAMLLGEHRPVDLYDVLDIYKKYTCIGTIEDWTSFTDCLDARLPTFFGSMETHVLPVKYITPGSKMTISVDLSDFVTPDLFVFDWLRALSTI